MTALCSGKICTIFPEKGALNFWKACTIALEYSGKDKSKEKIYAILEEPVINVSNISLDNLVIPAVPYLIYVKDGTVVENYFGDTQILHFLKSEKKPLDDYMRIE